MTMPMITGELRRWRLHRTNGAATNGDESTPHTFAVTGYVYHSEIWDDGEEASLIGYMTDHGGFFLMVVGKQVYRLPKDEKMK